ncbi:UNVERIFIED_CONTAM: hypothetical protein GTU68_044665 [Idotea baltica]|nr:hypothetical protein [Idotea baltica]
MKLNIYQVDAFTDQVFGGNPAAVCPLDEWLADELMQKIAEENNLAETAFFVADGDQYSLRWFTPAMEMDLFSGLPEKTNIIASAPGDDCDFVSRFFAPLSGVDEDPVTGSAHCTLIPYWADRLGKQKMKAKQISPRGGDLWVAIEGNRVQMAGQAVTYLKGNIVV